MSTWNLAIDFGSSNTAAAILKEGEEARPVNLGDYTSYTTPSAVFAPSSTKIISGPEAVDAGNANPIPYISNLKRKVHEASLVFNGYSFETSDLVAAVYRGVLEKVAAQEPGAAPGTLVLTHPEKWKPEQIEILVEAARKTTLATPKIVTVSEPLAAAYYYAHNQQFDVGARIGIFDFGGGTLDIAVLEKNSDGTFEVLETDGDNVLGGESFDEQLVEWAEEQLAQSDSEAAAVIARANREERLSNLDSARKAKELLSRQPYATIVLRAGEIQREVQITAQEFATIVRPLVERAVFLTNSVIEKVNSTGGQPVQAFYLTGGSSNMPIVQQALQSITTIKRLDNPKLVVAQGALYAPQHGTGANKNGKHVSTKADSRQQPTEKKLPASNHTEGEETSDGALEKSKADQGEKKPKRVRKAALVAGAVALVGGAILVGTKTFGNSSSSYTESTSAMETEEETDLDTTLPETTTPETTTSVAAETTSQTPASEVATDEEPLSDKGEELLSEIMKALDSGLLANYIPEDSIASWNESFKLCQETNQGWTLDGSEYEVEAVSCVLKDDSRPKQVGARTITFSHNPEYVQAILDNPPTGREHFQVNSGEEGHRMTASVYPASDGLFLGEVTWEDDGVVIIFNGFRDVEEARARVNSQARIS